MNYPDHETEHLRLTILKVLEGDPDYETNEHVLRTAVATVGIRTSFDAMRTQLSWLAEQKLLTDRMIGETYIVTLTPRGQDVANATTRVPGVARPIPGQ